MRRAAQRAFVAGEVGLTLPSISSPTRSGSTPPCGDISTSTSNVDITPGGIAAWSSLCSDGILLNISAAFFAFFLFIVCQKPNDTITMTAMMTTMMTTRAVLAAVSDSPVWAETNSVPALPRLGSDGCSGVVDGGVVDGGGEPCAGGGEAVRTATVCANVGVEVTLTLAMPMLAKKEFAASDVVILFW